MTKASDILPGHWCQNVTAKDSENRATYAASANAVSWCLMGAIDRVYPDLLEREDAYLRAYKAIGYLFGYRSIIAFNDDPLTTEAQILEACRLAGV